MQTTTITYVVSWREWQGIEPCGATEWNHKSQRFRDETAAKKLYDAVSKQHSYAKLVRVTEDLIDVQD